MITKILFISDINYCAVPQLVYSEEKVDSIFSDYQLLAERINEEEPTHIVISGNITYSGLRAHFDNFNEAVLNDYLLKKPETRVICCPGQNDMNPHYYLCDNNAIESITSVTKVNFVNDTVKMTNTNDPNPRNIIAKVKCNLGKLQFTFPNLYDAIYEGFSDFFKAKLRSSATIKYYLFEETNHRCGIVHDIDHSILFVVLNSSMIAWPNHNHIKLYNKAVTGHDYSDLILEHFDRITEKIEELKQSNVLKENIVIGVTSFGECNLSRVDKVAYKLLFKNFDLLVSGNSSIDDVVKIDKSYYVQKKGIDSYDSSIGIMRSDRGHRKTTYEISKLHKGIQNSNDSLPINLDFQKEIVNFIFEFDREDWNNILKAYVFSYSNIETPSENSIYIDDVIWMDKNKIATLCNDFGGNVIIGKDFIEINASEQIILIPASMGAFQEMVSNNKNFVESLYRLMDLID
jgi:hypothetical protein